jgi:adenylyltransferase/sulfurtransferase
MFPETEWRGEAVEIADLAEEYFVAAEMIFSCVDTDLARTEIAALAARYKLPVCDAGLGGTEVRVGRVSWFPGDRSAACFACLLTARRRAALLISWESDVKACWADNERDVGVWTSTRAMACHVADLQLQTALENFANGTEAFSIRLDLDRDPASESIDHRRSTECPFHDTMPEVLFPICTRAQCRGCGIQFSPGKRIGWLRRWAICPSCGSRDLFVCESRHKMPQEIAS